MRPNRPAILTLLLISLALILVVAGCSQRSMDVAPEMAAAKSYRAEAAEAASAAGAASPTTAGPDPGAIAAMAARKLIRTATLTVEVDDATSAAQRIEELAESRGGYVSGIEGVREGNGRGTSAITIRVPHDQFQVAMKALRGLGKVERENLATQDVGREYADIEARLGTKRAVADRMREILATKTAKLEDLFEAERQLAIVLEEIERLEGQRRYFDHQVALSTITTTVHEPQAIAVVAAAELPPFLQPARGALLVARSHLSQLLGAAVYVAIVVGPWLLLTLLGWKLATMLRRRATPARS